MVFGLFNIALICNKSYATFTEPYTNWGTGVYWSSISLGDIDNDGDLDLIVTGEDSGNNPRLDKYINTNSTTNKLPNAPIALNAM